MTNEELLKLAAKAIKLDYEEVVVQRGILIGLRLTNSSSVWNPLTEYEDAFVLAVGLLLFEREDMSWLLNYTDFDSSLEERLDVICRAITIEAAKIGRLS